MENTLNTAFADINDTKLSPAVATDEIELLMAQERGHTKNTTTTTNFTQSDTKAYRHHTFSLLTHNTQLSYLETQQLNNNAVPRSSARHKICNSAIRSRQVEMAGDLTGLWTTVKKTFNQPPQETDNPPQIEKRITETQNNTAET